MTGSDPSVAAPRYLLDNRAAEAEQRFDSLSAMFDAVTIRHLTAIGVGPGWRCWEVGVGGPSILGWLAGQVGPTGRVLATDIDTRWAQAAASANVEVRRHDVAEDPPPAGPFDVVHARLVLIHVPERERALERMVSALRPGGWLLIEDFDPALQPLACPDAHGDAQQVANRVRAAFRALLSERGADLSFGRRLPRMFRDAGLMDVGADAYLSIALPAAVELEKANVQQVREALVLGGHVSAEEVDAHLAALDAGGLDVATAPLISAWGRSALPPSG
jgi:SAM-dependent methyltransferase